MPVSQPDPTAIASRFLRIGIDLHIGGAITHVSEPGGANLINSFDWGRQIQQSYYSGPANYQRPGKEKSRDWAGFPWNPIQSGDAFRNGSRVLEHRVQGNELYVKTVPMLWPMRDDAGECVMETWVTLDASAPRFTYRARLTNAREDRNRYGAHSQELPAIYTNGAWHRLVTYAGDRPFTGGEVVEVRNDHHEPWPWMRFLASEGWAALLAEDGRGIGVCMPQASEFHGGFAGQRGSGGDKDFATGYMSPIRSEILDHDIVYEYACTMVVGSLDEIRAEARRLHPATLPAWTFAGSRQGWTIENGQDEGWRGPGKTVHAADPGRPVRLLGPIAVWRAEAAPRVRIRVSAVQAGELRLFWRGMPPAEALTGTGSAWSTWQASWWSPDRSVAAALPIGTGHVIELPLADHPGYIGGITGLALDLPDGATLHEVRLLAGASR